MKKNKISLMAIALTLVLTAPIMLTACGNKTKNEDSVNNNKSENGQDAAGNDNLNDEQDEKSNEVIEKAEVKDITALAAADAILAVFDKDSLPGFSLKLYGVFEDNENYLIEGLASTLFNGTTDPVEELEYADDYAFYIPKGALVFEVDVIKVRNEADIQAVEEMFKRRLALKDDGNVRLYNPEEVVLLEAGEVVTIGNYVVLLVTSDNEMAKEALNNILTVK